MRHDVVGRDLQPCLLRKPLALSPAPRARRMQHAPRSRALIAPTGFALKPMACHIRAATAAVNLAAVAAPAQQHLRTTAPAHKPTTRVHIDQLLELPEENPKEPTRTARANWTNAHRQCNTAHASGPQRHGVRYSAVICRQARNAALYRLPLRAPGCSTTASESRHPRSRSARRSAAILPISDRAPAPWPAHVRRNNARFEGSSS
jgi:hypothetical protein